MAMLWDATPAQLAARGLRRRDAQRLWNAKMTLLELEPAIHQALKEETANQGDSGRHLDLVRLALNRILDPPREP